MNIEVDYGYLVQAQAQAGEIASEVRSSTGRPGGNASACGAPPLTSAVSALLDAVGQATGSSSNHAARISANLGISVRDYQAADENESSNLLNVLPAISGRRVG